MSSCVFACLVSCDSAAPFPDTTHELRGLSGPSTCSLTTPMCPRLQNSITLKQTGWKVQNIAVFLFFYLCAQATHFLSPYFLNKTFLYSCRWHIILLPPSICLSCGGFVSSVRRQWEPQCAVIVTTHILRSVRQSDSLQIYLYLPTLLKNKETGACWLPPF